VEVERDVGERASCDVRVASAIPGVVSPQSPWSAAAEQSARIGRALQTISPRLRRRIFERDGGRCRIPGCRNTCWLEAHHLRFQSEGGENSTTNILLLCSAHHAALHRGRIRIEGSADGEIRVFHADGSPYGASLRAASLPQDVADAIAGLRSLGFEA